jgi:Protein of unknown function (DUF2652).
MDNKGLLFIPDISGFTRFINETEIEHSRYIIQELLEILINANRLGLEISEIEGDAILFYKFGAPPAMDELYEQVQEMFYAFHRHLMNYDRSKYCQCMACKRAIDLTLKVVTHYGEFAGYNVKNFNKLIGKDVIVAHQLLKNDIEQHEYWLVTKNLTPGEPPADPAKRIQWMRQSKQTETGAIDFHYALLSQLKNDIPPEPSPQLQLTGYTKMLSFTREYETDIITLFHGSGDFNYRHRWQEGVQKVEEVDHLLPRIGMRCRIVKDNGESMIYSSSYHYHPEHIEFSETNEQDNTVTYYTLEKVDEQRSRLTINMYVKKTLLGPLLFQLHQKRKLETMYNKSLDNLGALLKEIHLPALNQ